MLKVLALHHTEKLDGELFRKILLCIDEERQNKILKFHKREDAERSLLGDFLVRAVLCEMLHVKNGDIRIKRDAMGKPYVGNTPGVFFSISHSGNWITAAFDSMPVGIDIERVKKVDPAAAGNILDTGDYAEMTAREEGRRQHYFYKCWTYHESYVKMRGQGMTLPLAGMKKLAAEAFFKVYSVDPCYLLTVCSVCDVFPEKVVLTGIEELLENTADE